MTRVENTIVCRTENEIHQLNMKAHSFQRFHTAEGVIGLESDRDLIICKFRNAVEIVPASFDKGRSL
jgi:hypothetical protein